MKIFCRALLIILALSISIPAYAKNIVSVTYNGQEKCINSNGVPSHKIGNFPTKGNPHRFKPQNIKFCFSLNPKKLSKASDRARVSGVTLTGIPIRPGTADWYDPNSRRGHSKNSSSGWKLEAITPEKKLFGLDANNAHVDKRGLYHYHGVNGNLFSSGSTQIGYAADGFEIHYLRQIRSSYQLRSGNRKTMPFGRHDGAYKQDYIFVKGSGNLDECNGMTLQGKYVYFATDKFPFFPRCHWGKISRDFLRP